MLNQVDSLKQYIDFLSMRGELDAFVEKAFGDPGVDVQRKLEEEKLVYVNRALKKVRSFQDLRKVVGVAFASGLEGQVDFDAGVLGGLLEECRLNILGIRDKQYPIDFSNVFKFFNGVLPSYEDLKLRDIIESYGVHDGFSLLIKEEDSVEGLFGKCALYFDPTEKKVYFNLSDPIPFRLRGDIAPENVEKTVLRNFNRDYDFGLHENLIHDRGLGIGGGFYTFFKNNQIYFFETSSQFGKLDQGLVESCIAGTGYSIHPETKENVFRAIDFNEWIISMHGLGSGYFRDTSRGREESSDRIPPEDDIPF